MALNTWTRSGSEKAQASQTIRMLMKTLQYLAEDASTDGNRERSFLNVARSVIKNVFSPSNNFSVNEQVSVVFNAMGWKNTQITLTSANEAELILGSNRYLDQDPDSIDGLRLLVKTLCSALGSYLFDKDVQAKIDIDIHTGPTYKINLKTVKSTKSKETTKIKTQAEKSKETSSGQISSTSTRSSTSSDSGISIKPPSTIDTTQIFLPVLSNSLPLDRLYMILQDVLAEFCQSWYGSNPLETQGTDNERENLLILITFLTEKTFENDSSRVEVGEQVGTYFAHAIRDSFQEDKYLTQEIIDGSSVGSIIRDIKARAFCYLKPGEKCGPKIGAEDRSICDFAMGIWQGCLSQLMKDSEFEFTGFYPAGRKDPYCLMEFEVN